MKIFKKITVFFLISSILAVFFLPALAVEDPEADCGAAILADLNTGTVIYAKNADEKMYPASLTKVMTAIVALDAYQNGTVKFSDTVTLTSSLYRDIGSDGSSLKFEEGERITFEELLYCVIMTSANEPCNAIAEYVSGDISAFIDQMNRMAQALGCTGTHFSNTHGMPDVDNYSTARDLFKILQKAMTIPQFTKISGTEEHTVPATNKAGARKLTNTNNLIRQKNTYYYEYAKAGKTGYTDAAGYCVAAAAQKGDLSLGVVVLKAKSIIAEDGTTKVNSFLEAKRLLQWGFSNFSYRTVLSTMDLVAEIPVTLGAGANTVVLRPENSITLLLENDINTNLVHLDIHLKNADGQAARAPIVAGEILGDADVSLQGKDCGTVRLVANSSVDLDRGKFLTSQITGTLGNRYVRLAIVFLIVLFVAYIAFIIIYNINRIRRKRAADAVARQRIAQLRAQEDQLTTGMTFEEIEKKHAARSYDERYKRR
ncbi:MAG: D-alanyl-D-alanine carboxypeptidase [Oscillospiraceae bacterium]|nr:D-alanyl-D-alanine carboxypeptidase [Oscillospiraceae bacterium]